MHLDGPLLPAISADGRHQEDGRGGPTQVAKTDYAYAFRRGPLKSKSPSKVFEKASRRTASKGDVLSAPQVREGISWATSSDQRGPEVYTKVTSDLEKAD